MLQRPVGLMVLVAAVVVMCASAMACGGGGTSTNAQALTACLEQRKPANATLKTDPAEQKFYVENAGDGGVEVLWGRNQANVAVERNASDAGSKETFVKDLVRRVGGSADLVQRRGNVVIQYTKTPNDAEKKLIEDCL